MRCIASRLESVGRGAGAVTALALVCAGSAGLAAEAQNQSGDIKYQDGAVYTGAFEIETSGPLKLQQRRYPHGKGAMVWPDGARFEGTFDNGKPQQGTYFWGQGEWCAGPVTEGYVFDTQANCRFADGTTYTGGMKGNRPDGQGAMRWPGGNRFEGTFKNGKPVEGAFHAKGGTLCKGPVNAAYRVEGAGQCDYGSGARYVGAFKDGVRHGKGKMRFTSGVAYEGAWAGGKQHGQGIYSWSDGSRFNGDFKDGRPIKGAYTGKDGTVCRGPVNASYQVNGKGACEYAGGSRYEGTFKDGVHHGEGTMRFANGAAYTGAWVNGEQHGQGAYVWPDGSRFEGSFQNSRPVEGIFRAKEGPECTGPMNGDYRVDGRGQCDYGGGTRYEGEFKDGVHHGEGEIRFASGAAYAGGWLNGKLHGRGTYIWADGTRYTGAFADDSPHGTGLFAGKGGTAETVCVRMDKGEIAETLDDARCDGLK